MFTGGKRSRTGVGHVGRVRILRSHGGRHDLSVDGQLDAVGGHDRTALIIRAEREGHDARIDGREEQALSARRSRSEGHQRGFLRGLAEHDGVGTQTAPALLTVLARSVVAVIDGHTQTELRTQGQRRGLADRGSRELDFVVGLLGCSVAPHDCLGTTGAGLMVHDHIGDITVHATQGVVIEGHLLLTIGTGDHQLDGVTVPRALGGVLVVVVGHDKAEIHVVDIIGHLHGRGLVIRTGPGAATVLFKQHVLARAGRTGTLGYRELGIGEDGHAAPLIELAVEDDRSSHRAGGVVFLAWLDVVGDHRAQGEESRFARRLAEHDGVGTQTAPALLTILTSAVVTVIDGHSQTELNAALEGLNREGSLRELDLVGGALGGSVAGHDRLSAAGAGFVVHDGLSDIAFHATESVVVEGDLLGAVGAGDHQLDRVTIPRALGGILVIVVGHDKAEVDVVGVENDLHSRGLVIRTRPGAATVLLEQHVLAIRTGALGHRELRVSQNRHTLPLVELTIEDDGALSAVDGVKLLTRLDVVLLHQRHLGRLARRLAEHDGVGTQTAPALLTILASAVVTVIDGHTQAELDAALELRDVQRGLRELDLIGGALAGAIAGHDRLSATGASFVVHDGLSDIAFHAAEGVVVESHLLGAVGAGDHQLDRVTIPRALGGILVIVVGHDEAEIDVVGIIDDLNGRSLVIRTRPGAATVLLEEHKLTGTCGSRTLGHRELRIGEHRHTGPFAEIAVQNNGFRGEHYRVSFLTRLDIIGC